MNINALGLLGIFCGFGLASITMLAPQSVPVIPLVLLAWKLFFTLFILFETREEILFVYEETLGYMTNIALFQLAESPDDLKVPDITEVKQSIKRIFTAVFFVVALYLL